MEANTRVFELREIIAQHDNEYYVLNAPTISDAAYDALYQELQTLEHQYPELVVPHSPTQRVGGGGTGTGGFAKVTHSTKMLSLDNLRTAKEVLKSFEPGEEVLVEPKIDGLSCKIVYEYGKLVQAITRGNGNVGDDVTANVRAIKTVPLMLTFEAAKVKKLEVLGEVYMTFDAFNKLNARLEHEDEEPMANARNAAAGALKLKDPQEVASRQLSFVAYGLHTQVRELATQRELVDFLEAAGFCVARQLPSDGTAINSVITVTDEAKIEAFLKYLDDIRKQLKLQTDGLVFKVNSLARQRDLGEGNKYPNWAFAFKYPPERKETRLLDITIQIGRTGKVTPVAELAPVLLSGTTVQRASLHNQDEIERLGVNIGDWVMVEKAAEIIPDVVSVSSKRVDGFFKIPAKCVCCDSVLVKPDGFVDLFCMNPLCEEQAYQKLRYALSKSALDLRGCGKVLVRELMRHGVRRLSDVFSFDKEKFAFLKPAARKNFLEQREVVKTRPFWRQLAALCIEGLGEQKCQDVAVLYPSFPEIASHMQEVEKVVGKSVFASLQIWLLNNFEEVDRLEAAGFTFTSEGVVEGPLSGKIFVITGTLMSGQRAEVEERIRAAGGVTKSSVTRKCNFVVQGVGGGRKKAEAVEKLGVAVISEEQLYLLMNEKMPVVEMPDIEALRDE